MLHPENPLGGQECYILKTHWDGRNATSRKPTERTGMLHPVNPLGGQECYIHKTNWEDLPHSELRMSKIRQIKHKKTV